MEDDGQQAIERPETCQGSTVATLSNLDHSNYCCRECHHPVTVRVSVSPPLCFSSVSALRGQSPTHLARATICYLLFLYRTTVFANLTVDALLANKHAIMIGTYCGSDQLVQPVTRLRCLCGLPVHQSTSTDSASIGRPLSAG